jgi:predicted Zn-ribbon and HTH transcriptional regulator
MKNNLNAKLIGYTANMQADRTELVIEIDSANPRNIAIACAKIFGPDKTAEPEQTTDEPATYVAPKHKITKTTQIRPDTKHSKCKAWTYAEISLLKDEKSAKEAISEYRSVYKTSDRTDKSIEMRWYKLKKAGQLNWQNTDPLKLDQKVRVKILGELREGVITKSTMNDDGNLEYLVTCGQTTQWTPRKDIEVL